MKSRQWVRVSALFMFFAAMSLTLPSLGQPENLSRPSAEQIDAYVESGMAELNVPGAAMAIFKNGEVTHLRGFGRIDGTDDPVTPQTPFQIASLTKSFTSLVVLQLASEGHFSIDDPVAKYIPFFHTSDPEVSRNITIRQLMNHRSGISTLDGNRYQRTTFRGEAALEQAVRRLGSAHLESVPGTRFHYSNANYAVLAHLIETIEGTTFEQSLETRIFSQLGMDSTYVQVTTKSVAPEAKGHILWFGIPVESHFIAGRMMMGAGGVTTSAEDLAKYMIAVSQSDPRIVPAALSDSFTLNRDIVYAFGWEHGIFGGQHVIFHTGMNPGFMSVMMYVPESDKGALFMMNGSGTLMGNLPGGTMRYALDLPPISLEPSKLFSGILWGSLGLLIILAIGCVFSISRLRRNASIPWNRSKPAQWAFIVVPTLGLIVFAFVLLFYVPRSFGVNFSAASLFNPDSGVLTLCLTGIALIWAIARTLLLIRRQKSASVASKELL